MGKQCILVCWPDYVIGLQSEVMAIEIFVCVSEYQIFAVILIPKSTELSFSREQNMWCPDSSKIKTYHGNG
jgi:hypothetical protein